MKKNSLALFALALTFIATSTIFIACLSSPDDPEYPPLLEVLRAETSISTFVKALERSDFLGNRLEDVDYTILAPDNDAFSAYLTASGFGSVDSIPLPLLNHLINYHYQFGYAPAENITSNYYASPSAAGFGGTRLVLFVESLATGLFFNGDAEVVQSNIKADKSIIHIIDKVLTLPNAMDIIIQNKEFSRARQAMEKTDLDALLKNPNPYTVLVPTNTAFNLYVSLNNGYNSFDDIPKDTLTRLMRFHLIAGNIKLDSLSTRSFPTQLAGSSLAFTPQITGSLRVGNQADILLGDIQGTNGIVHAIDRVLVP